LRRKKKTKKEKNKKEHCQSSSLEKKVDRAWVAGRSFPCQPIGNHVVPSLVGVFALDNVVA
jgi:hypothetical protein